MMQRALVIWVVLLTLAVINGAFREVVLVPRVGITPAHQLSTLTLCAAIIVLSYLTIPWISPSRPRDGLLVGILWLVLTLLFEFGFGRWRGRSWPELLADYDLSSGRIWILVLVTTAFAPLIASSLRRLAAR